VSELATLEVELIREQNPSNPDCYRAEVTLRVKGTTLRACDSSRDMAHSINLVSDELAVQVKRHRDKRRKRRESRAAAVQQPGMAPDSSGGISAAY
jgi:putative sigma-54 modulation protein